MSAVPLVVAFLLSAAPAVETRFAQVAPVHREAAPFQRAEGRERAVVLIHGFKAHPFSSNNVARPEWHGWQKKDSELVQTLGKDSDVYAFAYAQNVAIERIADSIDLRDAVALLKRTGYREIVLVAHSAGGLIGRRFVEDHPDAGVTKVIQVSAPNSGSSWARMTCGVRDCQEPFLKSLGHDCRAQDLKRRADKRIPEHVQFVCLVCRPSVEVGMLKIGTAPLEAEVDISSRLPGDGVVSCGSQWSADLRKQGIPAVVLPEWHNTVMRASAGRDKVAELVRAKQPRWNDEQVAAAESNILGKAKAR